MSEEKCIPEQNLYNVPESIPISKLKIVIEESKSSICKIKCSDGGTGTGFFCVIPFPDKFNLLPVLITNYHVIKEDDLKISKKVKFSLDNEEIHFEIEISENRKFYSNEKYDVTIIEIQNKDNLDLNTFLEIDEQVFKDNPDYNYRSKTIYLIHYPQGKESEYSVGLINSIGIDNFTIRHLCNTQPGSSGCPIINLYNNRVIGVHKGWSTSGKNWNLGTFLKEPISKFHKKFEEKKFENISNVNSGIDAEKILKFLIKLFFEYKDIKRKINEDSAYEIEYYLINKKFVDKFKEIFFFNEFEKIISNNLSEDMNEEKIYNDLLNDFNHKFLNKIEKLNSKKIINYLSNISFEKVDYEYCEKARKTNNDFIKVYNNFELWTKKTYEIFIDIGLNFITKPIIIKCYFDHMHVFILTKKDSSEYLNIYQLK